MPQWSTPGTYSWVVPSGVTSVFVSLAGAAGGTNLYSNAGVGGTGDTLIGWSLPVTPGETLQINVGGKGVGRSTASGQQVGGTGGYNGGGTGGTAGTTSYGGGAGGGGASDIRNGSYALADRLIVAGGGGGAGAYTGASANGGAAGYPSGVKGASGGSATDKGGLGGTSSSGGAAGPSAGETSAATAGALGAGGVGASGDGGVGGGGGGGYYGGGGGGRNASPPGGGGGGGSSYIGAATGGTATTYGSTGDGWVRISVTPLAVGASATGAGYADAVAPVATGGIDRTGQGITQPIVSPFITNLSPRSGPTTTSPTITLTGINLGNAETVTFGGVEAEILTNTPTQITVALPERPSGAGTVDVVVTTTSNGSSPLSGDYRFDYYLKCVVTSVVPSQGFAVGGDLVNIYGVGFTSTGLDISFGGVQATSRLFISSTQVRCNSPAGTADTTVHVRVTNVRETSDETDDDLFTYLGTGPVVTGFSQSEGLLSGGYDITINGSNFTGATAVVFGSQSATILSVSDTAIVVTVPPQTTVGYRYVRVTTPVAQSQQSTASRFMYYRDVTVTSVTPSSGTDAGGTRVTINGTGFTGATAVAFDGVPGTSLYIASDTQIAVTTPAHAPAAVHVRVTNSRATSPETSADLYTYIAGLPTITTVSPAFGPVAGGDTVTITGTNLASTEAVTVGGVAATITGTTSTTVTITVPPGTYGVKAIVVTNAAGSATKSNGYTYYPTPTITSLAPVSGPAEGGTSVRLDTTNGGFYGYTSVTFDGVPATAYTQINVNRLYATTPSHIAGAVNVVVTNPVASSAPATFTYVANTPVITGLTPPETLAAGGATITINGANFGTATSVTVAGSSVPFTIVSPTQITFTAPARPAGTSAAVRVVSPAGTSASTTDSTLHYYEDLTVSSLTPTSGTIDGNTLVTITGSGFSDATAVTFDGLFGTSMNIVSDTQLAVRTPAHAVGVVDVTVFNTRESLVVTDAYEYLPDVPVIISRTPTSVPIAGGTTVTITGTGFATVDDVTVAGNTVAFSVVSDTTITFTTPARPIGTAAVVVSSPSGSASTSISYYAPLTVDTVSPTSGPGSGNTLVTITGTGFTGVTIGGVTFDGVAGTSINVLSDTQLTVRTPVHLPGVVPVVVTNPRASSTPAEFTYTTPEPSITSLSPNEAPLAGGTTITINGTDLSGATQVTVDGSSVSFTIVSSSQVTFQAPPHAVGSATVAVATPGGTATGQLTYYRACTVTAVSPPIGPVQGGTLVTITGTGFTGATAVSFGGTPGTSISVLSDTQIIVVSPARVAGTVNVRVTNSRSTSPINSPADNYTFAETPVVDAITPTSGPTSGGTLVTLNGSGLDTATVLTVDGASQPFTIVSPTQITFTTPAHPAGDAIVAVANAAGGTDTAPSPFTYYAPVAVTSVSPSTGSTAGGTTVTVLGSGFTGTTSVTFGGTPGTSVVVVNDGRLTVVSPAHPLGTVDIRVTNPRDTSPVTAADEFSYVTPPTIDTLTPNSGSVVGGTTVTLAGSNFTDAMQVRFGGVAATNLTIIDDATVTVTSPISATPGPVNVTITTPGGTSNGVPFTYTNIAPIAVAAATPSTGDAILTVNFSADGSNDPDGGFIISWRWDFGDGATSSLHSPTHSFLTPGLYNVKLTVTDNSGTTGEAFVEVVVTERPGNIAPVPVIIADGQLGEAPYPVNFIGDQSYDPDGTVVLYRWNFGDGTFSTTVNPRHVYTQPGNYQATLTVTDNNGTEVESSPFIINAAAPPIVYPPVIESITPATGSSAGGTAITIRGAHFLGVTDVIFAPLGDNDGPEGTILRIIDDSRMTVLSPPGTGKVNIRLINREHTSSTSAKTLYTYVPGPAVVVNADPLAGYPPLTVQFSSNGSSSPYGIASYSWDFGNGDVLDFGDNDTSTDINPVYTFTRAGYYLVRLTITDRRGVEASATIGIRVTPFPGGSSGGGGGGYSGGGGGDGSYSGGSSGGGGTGSGPYDPAYVDVNCEIKTRHIPRGFAYYTTTAPDMSKALFSTEWRAQRLPSGVLFTATVSMLKDFLRDPEDDTVLYPSKVVFGAISMTADVNFPNNPPPSQTTANQGLVKNPRLIAASGVSLSPQMSAGLFTPVINGEGIEQGASFTVSGVAPAQLDIAYAQVGFLDSRGLGVGDISIAWVAVDCSVVDVTTGTSGWTISNPGVAGGGGGFTATTRLSSKRDQRRG